MNNTEKERLLRKKADHRRKKAEERYWANKENRKDIPDERCPKTGKRIQTRNPS